MRRPLGVGPFTGILILVGGLLLFGGCRTLGPKEEVPAARVLPGGYPLYFALDIADGGEPVAEILEEQDQPGLIVKTWLEGTRLWGAVPARDGGALVIVFEGEVPRLRTSLGLGFSRDWKKSKEGDWWQDRQGGQIAFTGSNRLYYSRGGMDQLRSREQNPFPPDTSDAVSRDMGRILGEGSAVFLGEGSGFLNSIIPIPPGVTLTRWILRMDRSGEEWRGGLILILEEEGQARFLGTTLKLYFLGFSQSPGGDPDIPGGAALFLHRLKETRVTRQGSEVSLGDIVFSHPEFSGLIKEGIKRGLAFP